MSRGIVVDHRVARVRYAIAESHFNEEVHKFVRDLKLGESVLSYRPRHVHRLGEAERSADSPGDLGTPAFPSAPSPAPGGSLDLSETLEGTGALGEPVGSSMETAGAAAQTPAGGTPPTQAEGSASAESQEKKEGN